MRNRRKRRWTGSPNQDLTALGTANRRHIDIADKWAADDLTFDEMTAPEKDVMRALLLSSGAATYAGWTLETWIEFVRLILSDMEEIANE